MLITDSRIKNQFELRVSTFQLICLENIWRKRWIIQSHLFQFRACIYDVIVEYFLCKIQTFIAIEDEYIYIYFYIWVKA